MLSAATSLRRFTKEPGRSERTKSSGDEDGVAATKDTPRGANRGSKDGLPVMVGTETVWTIGDDGGEDGEDGDG